MISISAIKRVLKGARPVIDAGDEIFNEYKGQLSMKGQPGVGDRFMKWVCNHRYTPRVDRVSITKTGNTYDEFPKHRGLAQFDLSDRKFVAVARAHPERPTILQATDSKWWGWKDALNEVGVQVEFVCPDYIQRKYKKKMGP